MKPETRFMTFEGPAQNGKSSTAILAFGMRVANSKGELHCIAARDLSSIRDNILEGDNKFLDLFHPYAELVGGKIGNHYIKFRTPNGLKKIILTGYSERKTWMRILGKPIENFLIDEINIADQTFIQETFARQFSYDHPFTICTLNGDDPMHHVYTDYINYSKDISLEHTPMSTIQEMEEYKNKKGYYYSFFRLEDHPLLTAEKRERIYEEYPPGSFYYQTKVLGVRGVQEGMIYANLIRNEHFIKWDGVDADAIVNLEIGIDIGDSALTVFTLVGYTKKYSRAIVIDSHSFNEADYDEIIKRFNNWITEWYDIFGHRINTVWPDSADSIFVRTLRSRISVPIMVRGSRKMTIKERVILKEQLLHQKRMLFIKDYGGNEMALMLRKIKTDGKGGHLDDNRPENDYNDSLDYALTPHLKKLSDFAKEQ
jgi:hypothetical protein